MKIHILLAATLLALLLLEVEGHRGGGWRPRRGGPGGRGRRPGHGHRRPEPNPACQMEPDSGNSCGSNGEGIVWRPLNMWFYNSTSEMCEEFTYNGCGGNFNRFWSIKGCRRHCKGPRLDSEDTDGSDVTQNAGDDDDRSRRSLGGLDMVDYFRRCGRMQCMIHCEFGRRVNPRTGCRTCSCNPPPADDEEQLSLRSRCPPQCRMRCPFGNVVDPLTGCRLCQCKSPPTVPSFCRPVRCRLGCKGRGFATDENGCEICRCRDFPEFSRPEPLPVDEDLESTETVDEEDECPRKMCRRLCRHGFRKDENGCQTCECNTPEEVEPEESRPRPDFLPNRCKPVRCLMLQNCPFGRAQDANGCETCRCASRPSAALRTSDDVCSQPKVTGPCMAYFTRFYFNSESGECERFVYGGCRANENNFRSLEACQERCEN